MGEQEQPAAAGAGFVGHPDGAIAEGQNLGELDEGGVEDGMAIEGSADLLGEHPDVPARLLLPLHEDDLVAKVLGLLAEHALAHHDPEHLGDEGEEGDGGGEGDEGGEELEDGEGENDLERVGLVGPHRHEVGEAAEDDEGSELEEDPSEGEDGGAAHEVKELEGDGEVGEGDEEVAHLLVLVDAIHRPDTGGVVAQARRRRRRHRCSTPRIQWPATSTTTNCEVYVVWIGQVGCIGDCWEKRVLANIA